MSKSPLPFNPGRFDGALTEPFYATGLKAGARKLEREKLVKLLRTKHKENEKAAAEALSMLKGVSSRIRSSGLLNMGIVLPGEIVGQHDGIIGRIRQLPQPVRDGTAAYVDERLSAISSEEI